jgi:Predicted ATPase (AAA+ superfamily)
MERILSQLERILSCAPAQETQEPAWDSAVAFRWRKQRGFGYLQTIRRPHTLRLQDLRCIEAQKAEMVRNTRQFLAGLPANNALLWGSRGTGKSSLVKALLNEYAAQGLRLIEVDKHDLIDLFDIIEPLYARPERFVLFCDDLSFDANDASYKALKAALEGSVSAVPENAIIYATSNRRHLLPEFFSENEAARNIGGEIHHGEAVEEKISLSERFGLWLSFHPFSQDQYLELVGHWLVALQAPPANPEALRHAALQWALARGSRNGRVAWQFARDWAGRILEGAGKS